jgi:lysophospholipase L1-like esterase
MRRLAAVFFGILIALLLLEGTLQALAYVTLRRAREEQRPASERARAFSGRRVLCVGDSYTYGIGAKNRQASYPARLEEHLRAAGGDGWIVVNEGWPSRNSQELNDLLPSILQEYDPDWVVVLIGINDRWSNARVADPQVPLTADSHAWTWKWRTKRLFEIAWANLRANRGAPEANEGSPPPRGPAEADSIVQSVPDSARATASSSPEETDDLVSPMDAAPLSAGSDTVSALRARLQRALASNTSKVATPEQRKEVYDVAQEAQRLGSEELAIDVVEAYSRLRMHTFAVKEGMDVKERYGESARLARALVHSLQRTQRNEESLQFAERAVELDSSNAESWRVLAAARFQIPDPHAGLRALLEYQKRGGEDAVLARQIRARNLSSTISTEELEQAIRDAGLNAEDAAQVRKHFSAMTGGSHGDEALRSHLSGIATHIRTHGARALFMNYPTPGALAPAAQNQSIAEIARREGIPFLDLRALLEKESAGQPREEFFISDGHCTSRGYDIVAKAVAAMLTDLDRSPPTS